MIKAHSVTKDGRKVVLLGLSDGNLDLLREHRPIAVECKELVGAGLDDVVILVCWGETEAIIVSEFEALGVRFLPNN